MALSRGKRLALKAIEDSNRKISMSENFLINKNKRQKVDTVLPCGENYFTVLVPNFEIPTLYSDEQIIVEEILETNPEIDNVNTDGMINISVESKNDEIKIISTIEDVMNTHHVSSDANEYNAEDNIPCSDDEKDSDYDHFEENDQDTHNEDSDSEKNNLDGNTNDDNEQNEDIQISDREDDSRGQSSTTKSKLLVSREERMRNKYLRMRGKSYMGLMKDEDGKYKLKRKVGSREIGKSCRSQKCQISKVFKCNSFSEEERHDMFEKFWNDLTWDMKRTYISNLVDSVAAKRKKENSRRNDTLVYSLKKGKEKVRVCKKMFLSTLGVKEWTVRECSKKQFGIHIADGDNSFNKRARNVSKEKKALLQQFLDELPKMPSHYCRSSTSKLYLEPTFQSKLELYREYSRYCEVNDQRPFTEKVLMDALKENNIKLYRPRKDQCDICIGHNLGNISDEIFTSHQKRKDLARKSKEEDKRICKESNGRSVVLTVDTQAVKLAPMLKASAIYYKTKLGVHNYTIYNLLKGDVVCYLWDESQGGLEANNFATMLINYMSLYLSNNPDTQEFIIYSDGCGYQNKNCLLANALLNFASEHQIHIYQKYFEKGHSQMEVDSVHSSIERKLKNRDIYLPTDYIAICREARIKNPYVVKYMSYEDFKDYSRIHYYSSIRPGYKKGDPTVTELHCLKYLPSLEIKYKLNYDDEWSDFSKRPKMGHYSIVQLYKSRPKIKIEKFNHLQALKNVLDKQFWEYYDNLPH